MGAAAGGGAEQLDRGISGGLIKADMTRGAATRIQRPTTWKSAGSTTR